MQIVNHVQIVSDFLKSEDWTRVKQALGAANRTIELGVIDGVCISLEKDGFKARQGEQEETANAYDVFDAVMAGQPEPSGENGAVEVFRRRLLKRCAALSA